MRVVITLLLCFTLAQDPAALDAKRLEVVRSAIGKFDPSAEPWYADGSAYLDLAHSHAPAYPSPADVPYLLALLEEPGEGDGHPPGITHAEYVRVRALQAARSFPIVAEDEKSLNSILSHVLPDVPDAPNLERARYPIALFREAAQVTQRPIRESIRERVLRAFASLSHCADAGIRGECAEALGLWNDAAALPVVEKLLTDSGTVVLRKACWSVGIYDASHVVDRLRELVKGTQDADTRVHAAYALARAGQVDGLEALVSALSDSERADAIQVRLRELAAGPDLVVNKDIHKAWLTWWEANRAKLHWDADRKMFVTG